MPACLTEAGCPSSLARLGRGLGTGTDLSSVVSVGAVGSETAWPTSEGCPTSPDGKAECDASKSCSVCSGCESQGCDGCKFDSAPAAGTKGPGSGPSGTCAALASTVFVSEVHLGGVGDSHLSQAE